MQNKIQKQNGFTIVELLIAGVILSVGILAWAKTLDSSIKGRAISNAITTASEIAMAEFENTALLIYEGKDPSTISDPVPNSTIANGVTFTIERDIYDGKRPSDISPIHLIRIQISWNHYGNKSFSFERIVSGGKS